MLKDIMQFVVRTILIFGLSFSVNASDFINSISYSINNAASLSGSTNQSRSSSIIGASLKQIFGTVLINHGKGYSIARLGVELKSGDRVMTMDGAQAVVVQDDGCVIKLRDNSIFTIPLNSSEYSSEYPSACQGGNKSANKSIKKIGPYYARAIGAEAVTDVSPTVSEEALENSPLDTTTPAPDTQAPDTQADTPETVPVEVEATEVAESEVVEQSVEVVTEAEGGSFFNNLSTTQIVVTGVAVGLGLAVIGSSGGGGGGAVSAE